MRNKLLLAATLALGSTVAFAQAQPSTNGSNPNSVGGMSTKSELPGSAQGDKGIAPESVQGKTGTSMSTDGTQDMSAQTDTSSSSKMKKSKKKPR